MQHLYTKTAGEAWIDAMRLTLGSEREVRDGEQRLKEELMVAITIEQPTEDDGIVQHLGDPKMLEWMRKNFMDTAEVEGWGYSYGQRLFDFSGHDQIEETIAKLKKNPESKSATIGLMDPPNDGRHMPCITTLDFKIRGGKLMTTAFFRSQDAGKKLYADVRCLGEIAACVADGIGVPHGPLTLIIVSLHAYESDWERMRSLIAETESLCVASR